MIEERTGGLRFDDLEVGIGPWLTRADFLASPLAVGARLHIVNEPWCSWRVGPVASRGSSFSVVLYFNRWRLAMVELFDVDPRFGGDSWSDWSPAGELERRAAHDRWLSLALGATRDFPWGKVSSSYDEKSGYSSILIKYAEGS